MGYALVPAAHWSVASAISIAAMLADLLVNQALMARQPRSNRLSQPSRQACCPAVNVVVEHVQVNTTSWQVSVASLTGLAAFVWYPSVLSWYACHSGPVAMFELCIRGYWEDL